MILKIYCVTNKVTHSRFACVARNPEEAVRIHPTKWGVAYVESSGGWQSWKGGHFGRMTRVEPPKGWTSKLHLLCADEIGVAGRDACIESLAYQEDEDLRHGDDESGAGREGPDSTWGGYSLEDL